MNNINKNALIDDLERSFGVSIDKSDFSGAGVCDDISDLKELLNEHHVLVFKNQNLSEKQQIDFTKLWGSLENFPEADKKKTLSSHITLLTFPQPATTYQNIIHNLFFKR